MPDSDNTLTTYAFQLQTTDCVIKNNDSTLRYNNIDTSKHTYLAEKSKFEKTTKISITPDRYNSKTFNDILYSKHISSSQDYITEFYSEIINRFTLICTKTYIDWLMVRFDDIKGMIYQIKLYKHMKLDSIQQFKKCLMKNLDNSL